jgi:hypothetical protein
MRILKTQIFSRLRTTMRVLLEDCGNEQLLENASDHARHSMSPRRENRRIRISVSKVLIIAAVMVSVTGGVAFSATGHIIPDIGSATSSFFWSSPEVIDQARPYGSAISISSMTCASSVLCLGTTEAHGELLTSINPTGTTEGTWSVLQTSLISEGATGYALAGASCVTQGSTPFCLAAGRNFNDLNEPGIAITSTEPTGGASKWQKTSFPGGITVQPSCVYESPTTLCALASGFGPEIEVSTDPSGGSASWKKIELNFQTEGTGTSGVACPVTSLCAATSFGGLFTVSTEPTKQSAWTTPTAIGLENTDSLACPTETFCLASGSNEHSGATEIATTTDPSDGVNAVWHKSTPTGVPDLGFTGHISCSADSSLPSPHVICFASAGTGAIAASTDGGVTWVSETFPGALGEFEQAPATCVTNVLCVAGNNQGAVTASTNASSGESATWSPGLSVTEGFNEIQVHEHSCPSENLCVATDNAGRIMTSDDPAAGASSWSVEAPAEPFEHFAALDCQSTIFCAATDDQGNVLTSGEPANGAKTWTKASIDPGVAITHLVCPLSSLCVAIDENGDVLSSTNPAGGASAWTAPASLGLGIEITNLVCPDKTLCIASNGSGEISTSTHPADGITSWSQPENPSPTNPLGVIACSASTLCVASAGDDLSTSTDPSAGASSWSAPFKVATQEVSSISCPSTVLCVAIAETEVLQSTDPAIGGVSWSAPAQLGFAEIGQLDCPYSSLCVASDFGGDVYTSTNPAGGIADWTASEHVGAAEGISRIACASTTVCILGGSNGTVITGKGVAVPEYENVPSITGTPKQGETLTEKSSTWKNHPTSFVKQWERCDSTGGNCKEVAGADLQTYLLSAADVGDTIRVKETASNAGGAGPTGQSSVSPVIEASSVSSKEEPSKEPVSTKEPTSEGETPSGSTSPSSSGGSTGGAPSTGVTPPTGGTTSDKPLTEPQKLAKALKACEKAKPKSKRKACEAQAKKRYAPKSKTKSKPKKKKG